MCTGVYTHVTSSFSWCKPKPVYCDYVFVNVYVCTYIMHLVPSMLWLSTCNLSLSLSLTHTHTHTLSLSLSHTHTLEKKVESNLHIKNHRLSPKIQTQTQNSSSSIQTDSYSKQSDSDSECRVLHSPKMPKNRNNEIGVCTWRVCTWQATQRAYANGGWTTDKPTRPVFYTYTSPG
jgi:hypothetical protein